MTNPDSTPSPKQNAATFAAAPGYAAWRALAETRHAEMMGQYWKLKCELSKLSDEINDLAHVMGNGASGGTAWTLHPLHTNKLCGGSEPSASATS